jgi:hypothetical protein
MVLSHRSVLLALALALGSAGAACSSSNAAAPKAEQDAEPLTFPQKHDAGSATDARTVTRSDGGAAEAGHAVDAAPDVDNGAPSTTYPAPHPPLPTLMNQMDGSVLTSPKAYLVVFPDYPYLMDLQTFATNLTTATFWGGSTAEYGVGPLTVGGTITLTGQTAPMMTTQAEIEAWVATELTTGAFGVPDPEGIYTIFYPSTTTITQPNPVLGALAAPVESCVGFGGYHDDVAVALTDGGTPTNFSYAVIPTCDAFVNDLTAAVSHEWVESATDPFFTSSPMGAFSLFAGPNAAYFTVDAAHAIWAVLGGGEAGDLCEPEGQSAYVTPSDVGYTVQRTWSNLLASASHDPCAPDLTTPFFAAAPVLSEPVSVTSAIIGGTIDTVGVTIPVGSSKTIEVDLFSDGDTGGPFSVAATDPLVTSYGLGATLTFAWDRTTGVNGEKLHLTISVTNQSLLDGVHVFSITASQGTRQFVWSGVVKDS